MKTRKIIAALLMLAVAGTSASAIGLAACKKKGEASRTIYVGVEGTETAAGTKDDPRSISSALMDETLMPGDTIRVMPGTYNLFDRITIFRSGSHKKYINIVNDDPTQKAVMAFYAMPFLSTNRGVQIYSDYIHWDGIDICGAGDNGMYIGGSYNIIENSEFYDNRDTGLQLGRSYSPTGNQYTEYADINYWPSYNLIKNCTSYNNYDNETYGENADGFAAKLTVGYGNVFDGCIAYRNSDDGWDLFAKTDSGNIGMVIMYNCVAFENGFILETQEEYNNKFPAFDKSKAEGDTSIYKTECGDGNGFKLGGSIMEGEVFMYNCLSFNNRMHGVTDNSNPGVISIDNITSYNNGADVDGEGTVAYVNNGVDGGCGNINLARQTFSYNHIANVLSVIDNSPYTADDEYRGTVENSTFVTNGKKPYVVSGQAEYNTKYNDNGQIGTAVPATDTFKELPSKRLGFDKTIHKKWRNEDYSINMGDLFALKDDNATQGSRLNKSSWDEYTHYAMTDLTKLSSKDEADAQAVLDMAYLPIRVEALYQIFDLVTRIKNTDIKWTSSDPSLINITDIKGTSNSNHSDVKVEVLRPIDADKKVTLTASVTVGKVTKNKTFEVNVKKNTFRVGEFLIEGLEGNSIIVDKQATANGYRIPKPDVVNGTSDSNAIIDTEFYERDRFLKYATYDNPNTFNSVTNWDATKPGIWQVTETVTFKDNVTIAKAIDGNGLADKIVSKEYLIYVAAKDAKVDFVNKTSNLAVNKNGYSLTGDFTSPTGYIYSLNLPVTEAAPTVEQIKANANTVKQEFRATGKTFEFAQSNSAAYNVYYFLENIEGDSQTEVYTKEVKTKNISTKADFEQMLASNDTATIYLLQNDLDFQGSVATTDTPFVGVFNGNGHKLSNAKIEKTVNDTKIYTALFRNVKGGSIMNVTFEDFNIIDVQSGSQRTGIIGQMEGGYIYNVKVHNVDVLGRERVGGLVGQVFASSDTGSTTYIDRVSVTSDKDDDGNYLHKVQSQTQRVASLVGYIQAGGATGWTVCYISNCFIDAYAVSDNRYASGFVGRYDDRNLNDYLEITNSIFLGRLSAVEMAGGFLGGRGDGKGKLVIMSCVSEGTMYYTSDQTLVEIAAKNCSNFVGHYSANSDDMIRNCFAPFAEHNGNYDVTVFGSSDDEGNSFYQAYERDFWEITLTEFKSSIAVNSTVWDYENVWELVSESGNLDKPYVRLR